MAQGWSSSREELAGALARYVGYTTGAFQIARIADVTELFDQRPSRMKLEVVAGLQRGHDGAKPVTHKYAEGITDFAVGLGLVRRIDRGGLVPRLALTELGRAYRAATGLDLGDYQRFLLQYSVLRFDADVSGLLLDMALDGPLPVGSPLQRKFANRTRQLRDARCAWLIQAFPNPRLRDRLLRGDMGYIVRWIKDARGAKIEVKEIGADFLRHHASPRRGWMTSLGYLRSDGHLTLLGRKIALRLRADGDRYFWIGPPRDWFERLRVDAGLIREPLSPVWNMVRPINPGLGTASSEAVERTADFMGTAFRYMRLTRANQAPLAAVTPYIYFLEHRLGMQLDPDRVFRAVFRKFETRFAPMSQRTGLLGYYQLRIRR